MGWGHQEQSDKLLATPQRLLLERGEKATVLRNFTHCLQPPYCKPGSPWEPRRKAIGGVHSSLLLCQCPLPPRV